MLDDESQDATLQEENSAEDTGSVDWQKRYTDTQAEYTRNQQALADERKVWEDEQALIARVQEKFPHLISDEEEDTEDEDDFEQDEPKFATKQELDEFRAWQRDVENDRAEARFTRDLAEELGDREVSGQVQQWIKDRTLALGANRKALKQAVEEFSAIQAELAPQEDPKSRRKAPHVPSSGKAATKTRDFSDMSRDETVDWMVNRARELESQT